MTALAIEVKDLEFAWPSKAAFLSVPSLSLQQGQTLFVGGRSGSGKTLSLKSSNRCARCSERTLQSFGPQLD